MAKRLNANVSFVVDGFLGRVKRSQRQMAHFDFAVVRLVGSGQGLLSYLMGDKM